MSILCFADVVGEVRRVNGNDLHPKFGCVTPMEADVLEQAGHASNPCSILQRQVGLLEATFERLATSVDQFVLLGHFISKLWHEYHAAMGAELVRNDNETNLVRPLAAGAKARNLLRVVNDGDPAPSTAELLSQPAPGARRSRPHARRRRRAC